MDEDLLKLIEKYKYKGMHFHFNGLYILTKEQITELLKELIKKQNNTLLKG